MVQMNLTIPETLKLKAEKYSKKYGFRNVQELAIEAIREKIYPEYSQDSKIEQYLSLILDNKSLLGKEEDLDAVLNNSH